MPDRVEKACAAYWEFYRVAWRPLGLLSSEFDVPFADLPPNTKQLTAKAIEAALAAAEAETMPVAWEFAVGQTVEKFTGEAIWHGVIVARYQTHRGKRRYVVEVQPQGFQMIAVPEQLRASPPIRDEAEIRMDEREKCARIADNGMLVPPDGGSPTQGECDVAARIATAIRARGES